MMNAPEEADLLTRAMWVGFASILSPLDIAQGHTKRERILNRMQAWLSDKGYSYTIVQLDQFLNKVEKAV